MDRQFRLSPHFRLGEFVPMEVTDVPPWIISELTDLCVELLEPIRWHFGTPVVVHSGWRPEDRNASVGGVSTSDHPHGRAADFHVVGTPDVPWEVMTRKAFDYARESLSGKYGQVILEDHRDFYKNPNKLWVHISTPSAKHPGTEHDLAAVLVSKEPRKYMAFTEYVESPEPPTA